MNRIALVIALVALAVPPTAGAAVSTPHSGWLWGSPDPQGHDLFAVEFQGASGYAAGRFGTLLATGDAGSTWTTVRTGTQMEFQRLDVIDPDSLVVGSPCALRRTDDGGATFRRLPFTGSERRCTVSLRAISFPSLDVGYLLLNEGGVLKTTDGGQSFSSLTGLPSESGGLTAIAFATDTYGLLATAGGDIYRTTDGGATWTREHDGSVQLNGLYVSGSTAVAVGAEATFLVSTDSGDTWTQPATEPGAPERPATGFLNVRCAPNGTCLMTTFDARIARTADGGRSFAMTDAGQDTQAIDFASNARAVGVGRSGRTYVSDDNGASFTSTGDRLPGTLSVTRVRATSSSVAHVAGLQHAIARTVDGGETWRVVGVPTNRDIRDVAFPTADVGYALDDAGGLFRTDNGGSTWSILETDSSAAAQAVYAPDADNVLLVGPRGMRRSTDGGETFTQHRHSVVRVRTLVTADRAGSATNVLAFGPRVIALSTNRGRTWRRIVRPTQSAEVAGADFVSAKRGYVVETDGRMYTTANAGRTWTEVIGLGRPAGAQVAFSDRRHGWTALETTVFRTEDGGRSWHPQVITQSFNLFLAAPSANVGFAAFGGAGEPGVVFTRTGGDAGATSTLTLSTPRRVLPGSRTITVSGRLSPAGGGEQVEVRVRSLRGRNWRILTADVDSDGRFSIRRRVTGGTVFVAQWAGNTTTAGDGSPPLVVRVDRRR